MVNCQWTSISVNTECQKLTNIDSTAALMYAFTVKCVFV